MKILITGSNRGLGLEFVKQYLERGEEVLASCRNPESAEELKGFSIRFPETLTILKLDAADPDSRASLHKTVKRTHDSIDMLINNAGILSGGHRDKYVLSEMKQEDISRVFDVNTIAPLMLAELFQDLLEKSKEPKIINISSRMGSISEKISSSYYSYSASKSALNMFTKMLSIDLKEKGFIVLVLHPGHVITDMGGSKAPLEPGESIDSMIKVIDSLTIEDSGKFLNWDGTEIPW